MFLYCQFYLTSFSSLRTFFNKIEISSKFLPQKMEVQNAHQTQSCWLVAWLAHNNWVFTPLLMRAYSMSYCKKQTNIFFKWYCCIARKQRPQFACCIARTQAICDCWSWGAMTTTFFPSISQESEQQYKKSNTNRNKIIIVGRGIWNFYISTLRLFTTMFNWRKYVIVPLMNVTWYSFTSNTLQHFY